MLLVNMYYVKVYIGLILEKDIKLKLHAFNHQDLTF